MGVGTLEPAASIGDGRSLLFGTFGGFGGADGDAGDSQFWSLGDALPPETEPTPQPAGRAGAGGVGAGAGAAAPAGDREAWDGYHLWRRFDSATQRRPFWFCKETGESRWERPVAAAVQPPARSAAALNEADAAAAAGGGGGTGTGTGTGTGSLLDGEFDEDANRREFLQVCVYVWRD
jgi:hypothetical protein